MKICKHCKKQFTYSHYCNEIHRNIDSSNTGDFIMSAIVGYATDSAIIGGIVGGDLVGGIVGDMLNDDPHDGDDSLMD